MSGSLEKESLPDGGRFSKLARFVLVLGLLYLFLVAIQLLSMSFKSMGQANAEILIRELRNPFAGLAAGILATVMVQSSSVTTSVIVGMVGQGSGAMPFSVAVPMVMGANVGTTITNTLVSLGHVARKDEFRRAFAGATVHDFFNLLTVMLLFPLELATGFLSRTAEALVNLFPASAGSEFKSPLKSAVKWLAGQVKSALSEVGLEGGWLSLTLLVIAITTIVISLYYITKNAKLLMANRIERWLNEVLGRSAWLGLLIGVVITVSVQSSSITTSLLIPMFGAGILRLEAGFPIMLGANIGTTVTALLAGIVKGPVGFKVAVVHLLFNLCGTLIFLPFRPMRQIPIRCAERLADMAVKNRVLVVAYVGIVFVVIPLLGILIFHHIG